jgi:hypothetical protein
MVQTRAISRACRSAFAHVVVLIDGNLSTTPAEEVPEGGFDDAPRSTPRNVTPAKDDGQAVRARFQAEAMRLIGSLTDVRDVPSIKAWWPDNQRDLDMLPDDLFTQVKGRYEDHWAELAKGKPAGARRCFVKSPPKRRSHDRPGPGRAPCDRCQQSARRDQA